MWGVGFEAAVAIVAEWEGQQMPIQALTRAQTLALHRP